MISRLLESQRAGQSRVVGLAEHGRVVEQVEHVEVDRRIRATKLDDFSTRPSSDVTIGSRLEPTSVVSRTVFRLLRTSPVTTWLRWKGCE